jgi:isoleucyl-tRNA synthetase
MLFEQVSYKNVICLGLILDEDGEKMSKSKGNIVDPWEVLNTHGADAFRWYLYTSAPPGEPRRFSVDLVGEVVSKFWSTLWNTYSFFVTYANIDGWTPSSTQPPVAERDPLDRWVLAELHQLVKEVTNAFENYDATDATRPVQAFVETLSNWYVRLSRRRFWKSENDTDKLGAYATLYECLVTLSKLIAPTMPFLSEALYRNLVATADESAPISVHLARWPNYDQSLIDERLINDMRLVERLVSLGRAAREGVGIRVRQPLAVAQFVTREAAEAEAVTRLADLIKSELNVKQVQVLANASEVVQYRLNPLPRLLGKKLGKEFPRVQAALREGKQDDVRRWATTLLGGKNISLEFDGEVFEMTPEEVEVQQQAAEGFAVAEESGYLAALDTTLTEDLIMEGLAREVVRRVQTMRKDADFNIDDTITVAYVASARLSQAIEQFADYIRAETLSQSLQKGVPKNGFHREDFQFDGETLSLGVRRASS